MCSSPSCANNSGTCMVVSRRCSCSRIYPSAKQMYSEQCTEAGPPIPQLYNPPCIIWNGGKVETTGRWGGVEVVWLECPQKPAPFGSIRYISNPKRERNHVKFPPRALDGKELIVLIYNNVCNIHDFRRPRYTPTATPHVTDDFCSIYSIKQEGIA